MSDPSSSPQPDITCPNCGFAQAAGTQFCTNCGALLSSAAAPPADKDQTPTEMQPPAIPGAATGGAGVTVPPPYPVSLEFEGPEQLSRLSTFFRLILAIPLFIFMAVIGWAGNGILFGLVIAHWLSLLVRGGRPVGWIGSAIVALLRFNYRAYAYLLLLTDRYPAFEGDWFLQLDLQRPERIARRQIFFWKTFAVIPHLFCLVVLWFVVAVCEVVSWFAILFTGRFPKGLQGFVVGYLRWSARVTAYWISMRDEFPPYGLSSDARAGSGAATAASASVGIGAVAAISALVIVVAVTAGKPETSHVSFEGLRGGQASHVIDIHNVEIQLTGAVSDYAFPGGLLVPADGSRFVVVLATIHNGRIADIDIERSDFQMRDVTGAKEDPVFVSVGAAPEPATLRRGARVVVLLVFEVSERAAPAEFRYSPENSLKDAKFVFD